MLGLSALTCHQPSVAVSPCQPHRPQVLPAHAGRPARLGGRERVRRSGVVGWLLVGRAGHLLPVPVPGRLPLRVLPLLLGTGRLHGTQPLGRVHAQYTALAGTWLQVRVLRPAVLLHELQQLGVADGYGLSGQLGGEQALVLGLDGEVDLGDAGGWFGAWDLGLSLLSPGLLSGAVMSGIRRATSSRCVVYWHCMCIRIATSDLPASVRPPSDL